MDESLSLSKEAPVTTVRQLLSRKKNQDVCTIRPEATVLDAIVMFAEQNLGALIVTEGDQLVGVVSERDYARKVILKGRSSQSTKVREIMSDDVIFARPDTTIEECMALMITRYIRHLPVMDEDSRLIGVVSIGDIVKGALGEKEYVIDQLLTYITDSPLTMQQHPRVKGHAVN